MEQVAVDVFNFPESEFEFQKRLIAQQLMSHVLCSWWVNEQGSTGEKKSKLLEKLHLFDDQNLVPTKQLRSVAKQLEFRPCLHHCRQVCS